MTAPVLPVEISTDTWTDFISKFNVSANVISTLAVTLDDNNSGNITVNGNITIANTGTFKSLVANTSNLINLNSNTASIVSLTSNTGVFNNLASNNQTSNNMTAVNITSNTANVNYVVSSNVSSNVVTSNSFVVTNYVATGPTDFSRHISVSSDAGITYTSNALNMVVSSEGSYHVYINGVDVASFTSNASPNFIAPLSIQNGGTGANSVAGVKNSIGLGNVDNTSDANKPISAAQQSALDGKQDLVVGISNINLGQNVGSNSAKTISMYPSSNTSYIGFNITRSSGTNGNTSITNSGTGTFVIQNDNGVVNIVAGTSVQVNGNVIGNNAFRNITVSNTSPTGGSTGDIWLVI